MLENKILPKTPGAVIKMMLAAQSEADELRKQVEYLTEKNIKLRKKLLETELKLAALEVRYGA